MKTLLVFLCIQIAIVTQAQNTGIDEVNPAMKLHIKTGDSAVLLLHNTTSVGSAIKTGLFLKTNNYFSGAVATIGSSPTYRLGLFTFASTAASDLKERLTILDNGNVGVNTISPSVNFEVNGATHLNGVLRISGGGPGIGKVLASDASGNASWQAAATAVQNQSYETSAYNLSTNTQGAMVDFPTTNVSAPAAGTYLITYFLDAYNTFSLTCNNACGNPIVYFTKGFVYNKTTNTPYQGQRIDFLLEDRNDVAGTSVVVHSLPDHQISGSIVRMLNANDAVGFKMQSTSDASPGGQIRIRESNITLVRLL